ncbi:MAG: hypothetical protein E7037_08095 [Verrucomicrobia bacterium]|nr:hypothetical protein [Verrucomicrobiota bacterium]
MSENNDLISSKIAGYSVLFKPNAGEQMTLFWKLISEVSKEEKEGDVTESGDCRRVLFHDKRCRCWLVEYRGKKYLFKLDKRDRHRIDYLVQSFFLGSNAMRLMRTLHKAFRSGFRGAAEIFLVADKCFCGCVLHSFFLQEYVEGHDLQEASPEFYKNYGKEAAEIIRTLHRFGCTHGDAHRGNFILEASSGHLKTIDVGGKIPSAPQMATDRLRLEKEWGVKNKLFDWGYYWVKIHKAWRHFHLRDFFPHHHA